MRLRNIFKSILCGGTVIGALFSAAYAADLRLLDYSSSATTNGNMIVIDVFSAGTNTTHSKTVDLGGFNDVYVSFHCPANGITIGTATFGLEQSLDEVTYGSVTASELVRATNTLFTSNAYGSNTTDTFAGFYRGTNTSSFVGTLGTSTALTNQFYHIMPIGSTLKFQCTLTASGTDTVKYKIILRKGGSVNKF